MSSRQADSSGIDAPLSNQRLFVLYFTGVLIDLVVLNLFAEYWDKVEINSFTTSLLAAILLQVLLKLTISIEHRVAGFINRWQGGFAKFMRIFSAWLILFLSKFIILEAISFAFGEDVQFHGAWHGLLPFIVVVIAMLVAEKLILRFYHLLGKRQAGTG